MSPEEFANNMKALITGDEEEQHARADGLICLLLRELGYEEGVKIFEAMDKWYA